MRYRGGIGIMTAKEYFDQTWMLNRHINEKLAHVKELRELAERITAAPEREHVSCSRESDPRQELIAMMIDEENSANEDIDRLAALKEELRQMIRMIPDPDQRKVLRLRYLCFQDWETIAGVIHLHVRTVYRIHRSAIDAAEMIMKSNAFQRDF